MFPPPSINQPLSQVVSRMEKKKEQQHGSRKRLSSDDVQTQRYECFCSKQYLSHCALYGHVKAKHPDFFSNNRILGSQNLVHIQDPNFGYRIRKLLKQKITFRSQQIKEQIETIIPPPVPAPVVPTPPEVSQQKINSGYLLDRDEQCRIYQLSQIVKLKQRLEQSRQCHKMQQRKLKIYGQKMQNLGEMIEQMRSVSESYENIIRIINVQPIVAALDRLNQRGESEDEEYAPEE